ncbi:MAG: carbamate kinase [Thermoplasmata archaeon]
MSGGILVALGGNALHRPGGDNSWAEARSRMRGVVPSLVAVARTRAELVLTHGNGPQVGLSLRQNELSDREVPRRPLDVLDAETQGQIGYLIQTELGVGLQRARVDRTVLPVISRMEVRPRDPAFRRPTKPIGRFYTEEEARLSRKQFGWTMEYDSARHGWRRLVPSPKPIRWIEGPAVRTLLASGLSRRWIPVVAGGGGVPVIRRGRGGWEGVEAVIDKDLGAALVARELDLPTLAIVTDVPGAAVGYGRRGERWLGRTRASELERLQAAGEFSSGSMGPKVDAGLNFLRSGGKHFVITDIPSLPRALRGQAGTRVDAN